MRLLRVAALVLLLGAAVSNSLVLAGENDPLFVNMTTDDAYRSTLAITVSKRMLERGHPLTIFFNDRGVLVTSKANNEKFAEQQKMLVELVGAGATLIACPNCLKHYGIAEPDLLDGIKVGSAQITGDALFRDNTKTLSW
ncbi:MAG: DsrE family protein [Gammaproteobacteria bacterium]